MTAKEFLVMRAERAAIIDKLEDEINEAEGQVTIPPIEQLRPAIADDVVEGAVFYYGVGGADPFWQIALSVQYPDDAFKAYVAEDGCRYGLHDAWVEK